MLYTEHTITDLGIYSAVCTTAASCLAGQSIRFQWCAALAAITHASTPARSSNTRHHALPSNTAPCVLERHMPAHILLP